MHASAAGVLHDWQQIRAFERVATREYEQGHAHGCDLVDHVKSFDGGEFERMPSRAGVRATMDALQVASLGHLPNNQQRARIEVARPERGKVYLSCVEVPRFMRSVKRTVHISRE